METRAKLSYMVLGGALVFVGMVFSPIALITADKDKFGEIECRALKVVDANGEVRASVGVGEKGGVLQVFDKEGQAVGLLRCLK